MTGKRATDDRGTTLLLEHVHALALDVERGRPVRTRLYDALGPGLTDLLLSALTGPQGMRRRRPRD
jgi:hypothetical protein